MIRVRCCYKATQNEGITYNKEYNVIKTSISDGTPTIFIINDFDCVIEYYLYNALNRKIFEDITIEVRNSVIEDILK